MAASPPSYSVVGSSALLEFLLSKGLDPNAKDNAGITALSYARTNAGDGDLVWREIVEVLTKLGATE